MEGYVLFDISGRLGGETVGVRGQYIAYEREIVTYGISHIRRRSIARLIKSHQSRCDVVDYQRHFMSS